MAGSSPAMTSGEVSVPPALRPNRFQRAA